MHIRTAGHAWTNTYLTVNRVLTLNLNMLTKELDDLYFHISFYYTIIYNFYFINISFSCISLCRCGIALDPNMIPVHDEVYVEGFDQPLLFINSELRYQWKENIENLERLLKPTNDQGTIQSFLMLEYEQ